MTDPIVIPPEFLVFAYACVIALALVLGSFTTALIYRIPRGIAWAFEPKHTKTSDISAYRSACPSCRRPLRSWDLIPIFSWVLLRGRCRSCRAPISILYPLIESALLVAALLAFTTLGLSLKFFFVLFMLPFLVALFVIDWQTMILPDSLTLILGGIGLTFHLARIFADSLPITALLPYALATIIYAGSLWILGWLMQKLLKKEALGFGDVKFLAVVGLWLGLSFLPSYFFLSGVLGICFGLTWRQAGKGAIFPFGPALILAFFILLLSQEIWHSMDVF